MSKKKKIIISVIAVVLIIAVIVSAVVIAMTKGKNAKNRDIYGCTVCDRCGSAPDGMGHCAWK
jgi:HlyD family secretion protein